MIWHQKALFCHKKIFCCGEDTFHKSSFKAFGKLDTIGVLITTELIIAMDVKLLLVVLTGVFTVACLFFGTRNGYYDSDDYHGNGSAH